MGVQTKKLCELSPDTRVRTMIATIFAQVTEGEHADSVSVMSAHPGAGDRSCSSVVVGAAATGSRCVVFCATRSSDLSTWKLVSRVESHGADLIVPRSRSGYRSKPSETFSRLDGPARC